MSYGPTTVKSNLYTFNLPDVMPASVPQQKSSRSFQNRSNIDVSKTLASNVIHSQDPKGTCSRLPTLTSVEWNNACYILRGRLQKFKIMFTLIYPNLKNPRSSCNWSVVHFGFQIRLCFLITQKYHDTWYIEAKKKGLIFLYLTYCFV